MDLPEVLDMPSAFSAAGNIPDLPSHKAEPTGVIPDLPPQKTESAVRDMMLHPAAGSTTHLRPPEYYIVQTFSQ